MEFDKHNPVAACFRNEEDMVELYENMTDTSEVKSRAMTIVIGQHSTLGKIAVVHSALGDLAVISLAA